MSELQRNKDLLRKYQDKQDRNKGEELLRLLPQGPGSGLDADTVDKMHAEQIIEQTLARIGVRAKRGQPVFGGGAGGMQKHGNEWHEPDFALVSHSHTIVTTLSFAVTDTLETGADQAPTLLAPCTLTIVKVNLVVKTAPTGSSIIVDVNKNGVTIFTTQGNRPSISAGTTTGDSGTPDVTGLVEGDKITVDLDQVGSTIAGEGLTVEVICNQSV